MAELTWVGPPGTGAAAEIPTVGDLNSKKATALTTAQIDTAITQGLTGYSLKTYADTQDSARAAKSYVDVQDSAKILKTMRGAGNGPVPLDGSGLVPRANLSNSFPNDQKAARGYYSPASYAATQTNLTGRDQVKMTSDIVINDPGYRYKIVPFGYWECKPNSFVNQGFPEIRVKIGSTVIGWGRGAFGLAGETTPLEVLFYDPNDVSWTGTQTVTCWGGKHLWGSGSHSVTLYGNNNLIPPKLILYIMAANG